MVEHEVAVVAPLGEQAGAEAGALDPLEPVARDDLVGVDVGAVERDGGAGDDDDGFHGGLRLSRAQVSGQVGGGGEGAGDGGGGGDRGRHEVGAPAPALAALEVAVAGGGGPLADGQLVGVHGQAHRAARLAPVEAGGGEDLVEALGLGLVLHPERAGHDHAPACRSATVRPSTTAAAARRSSMRLLVHEPMNTVSTGTSRIGVPAVRPMYSRARAADSRGAGSANASGSGTAPLERRRPAPGWCPSETKGTRAVASRTTSLSKVAPSSVGRRAPVVERRAPSPRRSGRGGGPRGRRRWCRRGRSSPALAPASIDMLHTVMRPSIDRRADGRAAVLDDRADAAAGADAADDRPG